MHGGKAQWGAANASFKDGRYSKLLPVQMQVDYRRATQDRDLLALREDIALLDTRLAEVLRGLASGETVPWVVRLQEAGDALEVARRDHDTAAMPARLDALLRLVRERGASREVWAEVVPLLEQRRKLVESERKRLVDMQMMVTKEALMVFLSTLTASLREKIVDRQVYSSVIADVARLIGVGADRAAVPGDGGAD